MQPRGKRRNQIYDNNVAFQRSSPVSTKIPVLLPDLSLKYSAGMKDSPYTPGEKKKKAKIILR